MGTLCAVMLAEAGVEVQLWSNFPEQAAEIQQCRENKRFLPGRTLPDNVRVTTSADEAFAGAELIVSAVPCQFMGAVWSKLTDAYPSGVPVVSVAKGIEVDTLRLPTQILDEVLGNPPLAALSGPSIAPEVAQKQPCAVVAASPETGLATLVQGTFRNEYFRVYTNTDLLGVEVAGASKNVIALAAGIVDGLGMGSNVKAALLTRGLVEITRLGVAMGARAETFVGLAGVGDLVTTCISPVGRNRSAGEKIGRGMRANAVIASTPSVIEGIPTTGAILELAKRNEVEMPITAAVGRVLSGESSPRDAIAELMTRELKAENG